MAITYEQIEKANKDLTTVDVKGKDYVVVPQRVKAFRKLYPEGFITTRILSNEDGIVLMQARAGYYTEDGMERILGTGMAFEKQDGSYINKTSYIENCETSAIGRALGFMGLGIDAAICSAEELINAVNNQNRQNTPPARPVQPEKASVTTAATLPQAAQEAPKTAEKAPETPGGFIKRRIAEIKRQWPEFDFMKTRKALIDGGVIEDIPSATMNMKQAEALISAITANFEKAS